MVERSSRNFLWNDNLDPDAYALESRYPVATAKDPLDRVTSLTNTSAISNFGGASADGGDPPAVEHQYVYSTNGQPSSSRTTSLGGAPVSTTDWYFNGFGELTSTYDRDAASGWGVALDATRAVFQYDASGALVESTRYTDQSLAAPAFFRNHLRTQYGYDSAGWITSLEHDFATAAAGIM